MRLLHCLNQRELPSAKYIFVCVIGVFHVNAIGAHPFPLFIAQIAMPFPYPMTIYRLSCQKTCPLKVLPHRLKPCRLFMKPLAQNAENQPNVKPIPSILFLNRLGITHALLAKNKTMPC